MTAPGNAWARLGWGVLGLCRLVSGERHLMRLMVGPCSARS
jgi:hypothetical protein